MKALITTLLLFPIIVFGQITDTWDAVKTGTTDMGKIYVGSTLVWQKPAAATSPSFVSASSLATNSGTNYVQVSYPSGISNGDLLLAFLMTKENDDFYKNGWTNLGGGNSSTFSYDVLYKTADGTESGTEAMTSNTTGTLGGLMICIKNWSSISAETMGTPRVLGGIGFVSSGSVNDLALRFHVYSGDKTATLSGTDWTQRVYSYTSNNTGFSIFGMDYTFTSTGDSSQGTIVGDGLSIVSAEISIIVSP